MSNKDINKVCIALPAHMHFKFAKDALLADKDVYVEKPITLDINGFTITTNLNQKERKNLLDRIKKLNGPEDSQQFIDLKERLNYYLTL